MIGFSCRQLLQRREMVRHLNVADGDMRNKRLDILRCIAVFSVIILHGNIWPFFRATLDGLGVDLFFSTKRLPDFGTAF